MSRHHGRTPSSGSITLTAFHRLEHILSYVGRKTNARFSRARYLLAHALANPLETRSSLQTFVAAQYTSPLNLIIIIWLVVLYWGEVWAFDSSIQRCDWRKWEKWPSEANPHHIAFVADPQLVDPHTYPGRPWPLDVLTIKHTDMYMRRAYSRIQQQLDPNTILFLGDLFDGGREWGTSTTHSPEKRYRQYGEEYWLEEYERFSAIFLREWKDDSNNPRSRRDGRQIIASLPGNHDLGFARGVQKPVRDRFSAYFGDSNRLDIIANHTFVSLDTVSLSAAEQMAAEEYQDIWEPPKAFMEAFHTNRATAVARHLRHLRDEPQASILNDHDAMSMDDSRIDTKELPAEPKVDGFPTVLLTHVPLYRIKGYGCGPHREHEPPLPPPPGQTEPFFPDDANALDLSAGYQYQNVISGQISSSIAQNLGGSIEYVFSGDDHDYCEVVHRDYANPGGGIREVTVKSISEAMGVRKPGFVLASLWNPIDANGQRIKSPNANLDGRTLQSHLCLLPNELAIVMRYILLIIVSIAVLFVRAANLTINPRTSALNSLLPTSSASSSAEKEKSAMNGSMPQSQAFDATASTSASDDSAAHLSSRGRAQSSDPSPYASYGQESYTPGFTHSWAPKAYGRDTDSASVFARGRYATRQRPRSPLVTFFAEWFSSIWYVARIVVVWYLILFNWW